MCSFPIVELTMENIVSIIINKQQINGGPFWSRDDGNIYCPIGFSTIDVLNVLGDFGVRYKNNEIVEQSINYIFQLYDDKSKLFKYGPKSSKLPCITAKILSIMKRLEVNDERIEGCYGKFLETQQKDGGWRCATVKIGKSPQTDASNPGTTLYVLDAFRYRNISKNDMVSTNRAVDFLLRHWETRIPLGPCGFGIGSTFMKTEYPFIRYNIFYYLNVLSYYAVARADRRFREAMEELKKKVTTTGIRVENPET